MAAPKSIADLVAEELERRAVGRTVKAAADADPTEARVRAEKDLAKEMVAIEKDLAREAVKTQKDSAREMAKIEKDLAKERADAAKEAARAEAERQKFVRDNLFAGISRVASVATAAQNALMSFGGQLSAFVGKASPVAVMQWSRATDDLSAVIGRSLIPVLERVTAITRGIADAYASLSPGAQKLIAGLAGGGGLSAVLAGVAVAVRVLLATLGPLPILVATLVTAFVGVMGTMASTKAIGDAFGVALKAVGRIIEIIATITLPVVNLALETLSGLLELFADALEWVGDVITGVLDTIGFSTAAAYDPKAKSSVGASVRQAQIGDLSSFANRAYTSAFSAGMGKDDVPRESLTELRKIHTELVRQGKMVENGKVIRAEDRKVAGSSGLGRALHPGQVGTDGKTNFQRGVENIKRVGTDVWDTVGRMGSLL